MNSKKAVLFLAGSLFFSNLVKAEKIFYVDMQKVLIEVNEGKKAKRDIEKKFTPRKQEIEKVEAELQKMKDELERNAAVITPGAKEKKTKEFQEKLMGYQSMAQRAQMELAAAEREMTQPIIENLKELVRDYGEKNKAYIFEKNAVLAAPDDADITIAMISDYNKKYKVDEDKKKSQITSK